MTNDKANERQPKRASWQRPQVRKIAAGSAELGPNPGQLDGNFTRS